MAPVASGIAYRQEDRTVELPCFGKSGIIPGLPVYRISGVLQQVGADLVAEPVMAFVPVPHARYNGRVLFKINPEMLQYPNIDPVAVSFGPLEVRWYGLAYLTGILIAWYLLSLPRRRARGDWNLEELADLIFYTAVCMLIGGRLGSMVFYHFEFFMQDPLRVLRIWEGGMSFHGGLIGVIVGLAWFCRRHGRSFQETADMIVPAVPIGIGLGRLGNFANGELWGTPSTLPWAMIYPHVDTLPRHPSQLYEFLFEGIVLFTILWWYSAVPRPPWSVSGLFLFCYGVFRFLLEFTRAPDAHIGYLAWNWLTMGQVLSIPLVLAGGVLLIIAARTRKHA